MRSTDHVKQKLRISSKTNHSFFTFYLDEQTYMLWRYWFQERPNLWLLAQAATFLFPQCSARGRSACTLVFSGVLFGLSIGPYYFRFHHVTIRVGKKLWCYQHIDCMKTTISMLGPKRFSFTPKSVKVLLLISRLTSSNAHLNLWVTSLRRKLNSISPHFY